MFFVSATISITNSKDNMVFDGICPFECKSSQIFSTLWTTLRSLQFVYLNFIRPVPSVAPNMASHSSIETRFATLMRSGLSPSPCIPTTTKKLASNFFGGGFFRSIAEDNDFTICKAFLPRLTPTNLTSSSECWVSLSSLFRDSVKILLVDINALLPYRSIVPITLSHGKNFQCSRKTIDIFNIHTLRDTYRDRIQFGEAKERIASPALPGAAAWRKN
jgi:hypothetical protein